LRLREVRTPARLSLQRLASPVVVGCCVQLRPPYCRCQL
jgi:hypothetical protein